MTFFFLFSVFSIFATLIAIEIFMFATLIAVPLFLIPTLFEVAFLLFYFYIALAFILLTMLIVVYFAHLPQRYNSILPLYQQCLIKFSLGLGVEAKMNRSLEREIFIQTCSCKTST